MLLKLVLYIYMYAFCQFVDEWKCAHRVLIGSMKLHEWCLNINLSASRNFCICPSNCNAELAMDVIGNRRYMSYVCPSKM